jgi:hypothetical protein
MAYSYSRWPCRDIERQMPRAAPASMVMGRLARRLAYEAEGPLMHPE